MKRQTIAEFLGFNYNRLKGRRDNVKSNSGTKKKREIMQISKSKENQKIGFIPNWRALDIKWGTARAPKWRKEWGEKPTKGDLDTIL